MVASLVVGYWGSCTSDLLALLTTVLTEKTTYEEIMPFLVAMQRECHVRLLEITRDYYNIFEGYYSNVQKVQIRYVVYSIHRLLF